MRKKNHDGDFSLEDNQEYNGEEEYTETEKNDPSKQQNIETNTKSSKRKYKRSEIKDTFEPHNSLEIISKNKKKKIINQKIS